MKPYYQDEAVTIYHADCREVLPSLTADVILTDPPYGIGVKGRNGWTALAMVRDYGAVNWDAEPIEDWLRLQIISKGKEVIWWGGNYYPMPASSCWLVWDKDNGANTFADCELAWTNLARAVRMKRHQWHGMLRKDNERRDHPTQKPLELFNWCVGLTKGEMILDPFMGSGTTLRAAKDLGRKAIGIEIEERYCEIAAKRMSQTVLNFGGR